MLSKTTAFVAWVLAKERLETDASDPTARESGSDAKPARSGMRALWATEALPLDEPDSGAEESARTRTSLAWLFSRETLPLDADPMATNEGRPRGLGLRWLFGREELEWETPADASDARSPPHLS